MKELQEHQRLLQEAAKQARDASVAIEMEVDRPLKSETQWFQIAKTRLRAALALLGEK